MASHTSQPNDDDGSDGLPLRARAIRVARVSPIMRVTMLSLLQSLNREIPPAEPTTPPQTFVDALRRPRTSRRKPVRVNIDGTTIAILLNPQGRVDPEREAHLWDYVCKLVRDLAQEAAA